MSNWFIRADATVPYTVQTWDKMLGCCNPLITNYTIFTCSLPPSLSFSISGQALQCYKCKLGFWNLCITTKTTCEEGEHCYSGVGTAGKKRQWPKNLTRPHSTHPPTPSHSQNVHLCSNKSAWRSSWVNAKGLFNSRFRWRRAIT